MSYRFLVKVRGSRTVRVKVRPDAYFRYQTPDESVHI